MTMELSGYRKAGILVFLFLALPLALYLALFHTYEVEVELAGFTWQREIDVEFFGPLEQRSWSSHPDDAYNITGKREVHHYTRTCIKVGKATTCYHTPVYRTRFYYSVDRWQFARTVSSSGNTRSDPAPFWPEYTLANQDLTGYNQEREKPNGRREVYSIHFVDESGNEYSYQTSQDGWNKFSFREYVIVIDIWGRVQRNPLQE
jgi:hypothetical protein